jgi:regulator of protease activity HflC (stomatin/prohibitin superfamily)
METKGMAGKVAWGVIGLLALIMVFSSFIVIGAGERGVVLRLGAVQDKIFEEGLHFKIPFIETVKKLDVKTQKEAARVSAASKDLQTVTAEVALNYHLDSARVNRLWQNLGSEYQARIIDPSIQEAVKAATARYTAEELITKRPEVKEAARSILRDRLLEEYIIVDDFSIVDFAFSRSFNEAIEAKVTAEQDALAAKNKLEQVRYEAEQRVVEAKGEAEAIKIQAEAIQSQGGTAYVNLKAIEKWNGVLPAYMLGDSTPFINIK